MPSSKILPVLLAGGIGERLWPVSRPHHPKPFHRFGREKTLFEQTLARVSDSNFFHPPVIIAQMSHRPLVLEGLSSWTGATPFLIWEPAGRNTAPAVGCALLWAKERFPSASLLVLPSDHHLEHEALFLEKVFFAHKQLPSTHLLTFGISARSPEIGYGYIQRGAPLDQSASEQHSCEQPGDTLFQVKRFVEKPDRKTAEAFLKKGGYLWSSGIFLLPVPALWGAFVRHQPFLLETLQGVLKGAYCTDCEMELPALLWESVPKNGFDHAILEKEQALAVMEIDPGWNDLGTWENLWQTSPKEETGTVCVGECFLTETTQSYIYSEKGLSTTVIGAHQMVVVHLPGTVLVLDRAHAASLHTLKKKHEIS